MWSMQARSKIIKMWARWSHSGSFSEGDRRRSIPFSLRKILQIMKSQKQCPVAKSFAATTRREKQSFSRLSQNKRNKPRSSSGRPGYIAPSKHAI